MGINGFIPSNVFLHRIKKSRYKVPAFLLWGCKDYILLSLILAALPVRSLW